jgi:uncharacterized protein YjbJ (UPF0337 family)
LYFFEKREYLKNYCIFTIVKQGKKIMSIEDRAKSAAQNLEGKGQEAIGKATGSSQDEAAGQAKQGASKVRDGIEDAKDKITETAQDIGDKMKEGIDNAKRELNK